MTKTISLQSVITCPACGHKQEETMPEDACLFFYECKVCGTWLKPNEGGCCVFAVTVQKNARPSRPVIHAAEICGQSTY